MENAIIMGYGPDPYNENDPYVLISSGLMTEEGAQENAEMFPFVNYFFVELTAV